MANFESVIAKNLSSGEELMGVFSGKTAPTSVFWKIFNEASWLTSSNMPIVLGVTNQRLLIYKLHLNSDIDLKEKVDLREITSCVEDNGILNGGILVHLRNDKKYKFVFKKERVEQVCSTINSLLANKL